MNKHINSYKLNQDYTDAKSGFLKPWVAYVEDEDKVYYSWVRPRKSSITDKTQAIVGDIVWKNSNGEFVYTYSTSTDVENIPQDDIIGIVVIPTSHTDDGTVRVVSLDYMNYNNPVVGSELPISMVWGKTNIIVPNLPAIGKIIAYASGTTTTSLVSSSYFASDYVASASHTSDIPSPYNDDGSKNPVYFSNTGSILSEGLCGKENTKAIVDYINYLPGDPVANTATRYPAACCCHSYKSNDPDIQNAGYYYLPSIAELGYLVARYEKINFARTAIGRSGFDSVAIWTSSLIGSGHSWYVYLYLDGNFGRCSSDSKGGYYRVLAFVAL